MFYKYPYTNLYNLNLDWLIQAVKELQEIVEPLENVVTSVNGMTGNVELTREILTQILGGMVSKFNGRDGNVELTAADVNSTLIDITWTSDPGDTIDDLTQTELDALYTSGKRVLIFVNNLGVADQVYFLQYYDNHAMPQEYSPTSALAGVATFNGQTGNVTATGADLATSGTDQTTIAANLANLENTKVPNTRTVNNQPLSANVYINAANVPSQAIAGATDVEMALGNLNNSKVPNARQVNGKSLLNDITLNDEDIPSDVDGQTNVADVLNYQSQQIAKVQNGVAYIVGDTNTTGETLAVGAFVYVKGHSNIAEGLREVINSNILENESITTNNTKVCPEGGLNALNSKITTLYSGTAITAINVDLNTYHTLIFVMNDSRHVTITQDAVPNSRHYGLCSFYANESIPIVIQNICFLINESAAGIYIDSTQSKQLNVNSDGTVGIFQASDLSFKEVYGISK